jgi:hypothetical protein
MNDSLDANFISPEVIAKERLEAVDKAKSIIAEMDVKGIPYHQLESYIQSHHNAASPILQAQCAIHIVNMSAKNLDLGLRPMTHKPAEKLNLEIS